MLAYPTRWSQGSRCLSLPRTLRRDSLRAYSLHLPYPPLTKSLPFVVHSPLSIRTPTVLPAPNRHVSSLAWTSVRCLDVLTPREMRSRQKKTLGLWQAANHTVAAFLLRKQFFHSHSSLLFSTQSAGTQSFYHGIQDMMTCEMAHSDVNRSTLGMQRLCLLSSFPNVLSAC